MKYGHPLYGGRHLFKQTQPFAAEFGLGRQATLIEYYGEQVQVIFRCNCRHNTIS
jgi:hypothetical protein